MDEMNQIMEATHVYRKQLAEIERRNGKATQDIVDNPFKTNGEQREKLEKLDAELTAAELRAQLKSAEARIAKLEAEPVLPAKRASKSGAEGDEYAQRWINGMMRGDLRELRAQTALGTDSSGAAIPTDMERRIVELMYQSNVLRQIAVVNTIDSKRTIAVEAALPTTSKVAESAGDPGTGTAAPLSFPTFGTQISVSPITYVTAVKMSLEFLEDAIGAGGIGSGLEYVARKCATSMALKHEEQFTIGDGSGDPEGIARTGLITQGVNLGAPGAITDIDADDVIDVAHAVSPAYRNSPRCRYLMSDTALKVIRKLKTTNGDYIFSPNNTGAAQMTVGAPGTIYGFPYSIGQYVPTATAESAVYVVFGDFNYFEIFDRMGIESMVDPYSNAINRQSTLYVYSRTDSRCTNAAAFATIRG
jgi:HK97 family phage major capsid protein